MAGRPRLSRPAQCSLTHVDDRDAKFVCAVLYGDIRTLHRDWRQKNSIGQVLEMIVVTADPYFAFNPVVIRGKVGIVDRPVFTRAIMLPAFEISLAHPECDG